MAKTARAPPASHATGGLEASRSDAGGSAGATDSQKRGRGRPPKSKSGAVSAGKPSGRPKRNAPAATASAATTVAGRPRRSSTVRAAESRVTSGDGSRKRGRPKKDDVAAPAQKRGRQTRSEQVAAKKSVGRPKRATRGATGQGAADPGELKKKTALLQKKVKQAAEKLKIAVSAIEEVQKIAAGL